MKTERRHDLETNVLAVRITAWIEKYKPYAGQITGAVIVLLGLLVASSWWNSHSTAKQQAAWDAFSVAYDTSDPELLSLRRVADQQEYAGTPMQEWAYITWADRQVLLASRMYLIDRKASLDRLRQVEGIYERLMASGVDPQIQDRARFGLAQVYEMQNKLDEARRYYSLVQGDLQPLASERAAQLDLPAVQEACAWLATVELPKRNLSGAGGTPGERPDFDAELPETAPGVDLPEARSLEDIFGPAGEDGEGEDRYDTGESDQDADEAEAEPDAETDAPAESDPSADAEAAEPTEPEASADTESPAETGDQQQ